MAQLPIACSLTSPELRKRRDQVLEILRRHCHEQRPLPNGYHLQFSGQDAVLVELASLIEVERECCPFLNFQLVVEPDHGPVHLELTGPVGTREFLEAELGLAGNALATGA